MPKIKQIDISSPCAANWQDMVPQNGGRHCHSCNKMVIDFTAMPESKIIAYLSQHKNVCGQFYTHQLNALNRNLAYDRRMHPTWRKLMAAACVAGLLSVAKTEARPLTPTEQVSLPKKDKQKFIEDSIMVLKGKVIDKTSGLPDDRVIRGEIRTKPGQRFNKEQLIRSASMIQESLFKNWKSKI